MRAKVITILLFILFLGCDSENYTLKKFENRKQLHLTLDSLNTEEVPDDIGKLTSLEKLKISKTSDAWIVYPPKSAWNDLIQNARPNVLTNEITHLKDLKVLSLQGLGLTALPKDFYIAKT